MRNHHSRKIKYCPGCDKQFSMYDVIVIKGGLIYCPNCAMELKRLPPEGKENENG